MKPLAALLKALLPVALLLLLAEAALWLAGVDGPPLGELRAEGAMLARDPDEPGAWRTRLFGGTRPEQRIAPRDGRRRVLLFGGSNTQYLPENVLDALLESPELVRAALAGDAQDAAVPAGDVAPGNAAPGSAAPGDAAPSDAAPPPSGLAAPSDAAAARDAWEVINLGREGYGTRRVLPLVRQAMALEPDVVVLYAGHNEFLEEAFARERSRARGGLGALLVATLGRLRTARVVAGALGVGAAPRDPAAGNVGGAPDDAPAGVAAAPAGDDDTTEPLLATLDFADTLAQRAAYAANLRAMVDAARDAGAQVLLCTVVRNMIVPPRVYRPPPELDQAGRRWLQQLRAAVLDDVPLRFRAHLRPYEPIWIRSWYAGHDPALGLSPAPQRALLGAAARAPALDGPKSGSVAGAHWPDPTGWTPETFAMLATTSQLWRRDPSPAERAGLQRARARLDEGLARLPDDAVLRYDRGLVGWLLGEPDAVTRIDHSIDADHGPRTTTPAQNALVRALAAELDVPLLDAAERFRARSPDGLIAFELMLDHSHLQPGARVLLVADMARAIHAAGW